MITANNIFKFNVRLWRSKVTKPSLLTQMSQLTLKTMTNFSKLKILSKPKHPKKVASIKMKKDVRPVQFQIAAKFKKCYHRMKITPLYKILRDLISHQSLTINNAWTKRS